MRIVMSMVLILGTWLGPSAPMLATEMVDCKYTEQPGCFEIDILNFKATDRGVTLASTGKAQSIYNAFKEGNMHGTSRNNCWQVGVWTDSDVATSYMAEYHIIGRNGANPYTTDVKEMALGASLFVNMEHTIGSPDRVFRVCGDEPVVAIQFPWAMFDGQSYIQVCSENNGHEYPLESDGFMFTASRLMKAKNAGVEYVFAPFLYHR